MKKENHKTITEAIHGVMSELKMLMKDSVSQEGTNREYMYTSAAFAASMIRPLMIKHGIVRYLKKSVHQGRWQNGVGVDYGFIFRYVLVGSTVTDPTLGTDHLPALLEDVNYIDVDTPSSGKVGKSGDKSTFAAITTGAKYADLITYYLPMIDDVEKYNEMLEIIEEEYGEEKPSKKKIKSSKEDEPEEDAEEEEEPEVSANSNDYNYDEGVFDIIRSVFEEGGIEAVDAFTEGDDRKKVTELVEELREKEPPFEEDEPEEEEEAPKKKGKKKGKKKSSGKSRLKTKAKPEPEEDEPEEEVDIEDLTDEDGYIDLDELDYDNPAVVSALFENIELEDVEEIETWIDSFQDREQMKAFYTICLEKAGEDSVEFQDSFNEEHFPHLQERFEELE